MYACTVYVYFLLQSDCYSSIIVPEPHCLLDFVAMNTVEGHTHSVPKKVGWAQISGVVLWLIIESEALDRPV